MTLVDLLSVPDYFYNIIVWLDSHSMCDASQVCRGTHVAYSSLEILPSHIAEDIWCKEWLMGKSQYERLRNMARDNMTRVYFQRGALQYYYAGFSSCSVEIFSLVPRVDTIIVRGQPLVMPPPYQLPQQIKKLVIDTEDASSKIISEISTYLSMQTSLIEVSLPPKCIPELPSNIVTVEGVNVNHYVKHKSVKRVVAHRISSLHQTTCSCRMAIQSLFRRELGEQWYKCSNADVVDLVAQIGEHNNLHTVNIDNPRDRRSCVAVVCGHCKFHLFNHHRYIYDTSAILNFNQIESLSTEYIIKILKSHPTAIMWPHAVIYDTHPYDADLMDNNNKHLQEIVLNASKIVLSTSGCMPDPQYQYSATIVSVSISIRPSDYVVLRKFLMKTQVHRIVSMAKLPTWVYRDCPNIKPRKVAHSL